MFYYNKNRFSSTKANDVWVKQFGNLNQGRDITGELVYRHEHSETGWHIDHIKPLSKGGSNHIKNLQVLAAKENEAKADDYPTWTDTKGKVHTQKGY